MSRLTRFLNVITAIAFWGTATSGTLTGQNPAICNWAQLRAGVIRDTVYLDGGEMWWKVGSADGNTNLVTNNGNEAGLMYYLNYSQPFDTKTTNLTGLFQSKAKAGGAANNIAPNYIDGTMFANDDELYLYGGLLRLTDAYSPPADDAILGYEAYQYGVVRPSWSPGFIESTLPEGVTRYVTNGAGANIPSENLGFYFSGMRGADWGPIYIDNDSANVSANTLIEIDMSIMRDEKWTNYTLPGNIIPRANAQLVWVPVSTSGALIVVGGVVSPEEIFDGGLNSSQTAESEATSPTFMTSIPVYDIATGTWYLQNTTGDSPPQLTEFCAVMASASDGSSHNIYIYGGYDGLNAVDLPSDDVWVLSIPSFIWIKVYSGTSSHARSGHICTKPYPDQMFIIGGMHQDPTQCVDGVIQVFNLSSLSFQDVYNPTIWSEYSVPTAIQHAIGGDAKGGSTKAATWTDNKLSTLFSARYTKQITNYYPYPFDDITAPTNSISTPGSQFPQWAIIVLAVIGSMILLGILLFIFLSLRRRKLMHRHDSVSALASASNSSNRIIRWVNGMPPAVNLSTTPKTTSSVYSVEEPCECSPQTLPSTQPAEVSGLERFELHSETAPPRPPVEMATPYNSQQHRIFASEGAGAVGIARGSSAFSSAEGDKMERERDGEVNQSMLMGSGARNASWISSMGPSTVGHSHSSSASDDSKRVSGLSPITPIASRKSYYQNQNQNHSWGDHWPLVSPVSEEGTGGFDNGMRR